MSGLVMTLQFLERFTPYYPVRNVLLILFCHIFPVQMENFRKVPETSYIRELVNSNISCYNLTNQLEEMRLIIPLGSLLTMAKS